MTEVEKIEALKTRMRDALHDLGRVGKSFGPETIKDWWIGVKHEVARIL